MKRERLKLTGLTGRGLRSVSLSLADGGCVWVAASRSAVCGRFVDMLFGLAPLTGGIVEWFGEDLAVAGPRGFVRVAERVAHVRMEAGMLVNLRVWENLLLPVRFRNDPRPVDELEEQVLAALAAGGWDDEAAAHLLAARSDDLVPRERLAAMLVRAHLMRPEVLLIEQVTEVLADEDMPVMARMLDWLAAQHVGVGLLFIGCEKRPPASLRLSAWGEPEILLLEEDERWQGS